MIKKIIFMFLLLLLPSFLLGQDNAKKLTVKKVLTQVNTMVFYHPEDGTLVGKIFDTPNDSSVCIRFEKKVHVLKSMTLIQNADSTYTLSGIYIPKSSCAANAQEEVTGMDQTDQLIGILDQFKTTPDPNNPADAMAEQLFEFADALNAGRKNLENPTEVEVGKTPNSFSFTFKRSNIVLGEKVNGNFRYLIQQEDLTVQFKYSILN